MNLSKATTTELETELRSRMNVTSIISGYSESCYVVMADYQGIIRGKGKATILIIKGEPL